MKKLKNTKPSSRNVSQSSTDLSLGGFVAMVSVFLYRFFAFVPNFSPVGSLGFFGKNPIYFIVTIVLFDVFKGGFYQGFIFTYLGFAAYFVLGRLAKSNKQKFLFLPVASFLFFLVSNFGVWLYWYEHTWGGLMRCYMSAVPFYRNTLMGDLVFGYGYVAIKALIATQGKIWVVNDTDESVYCKNDR